MSRNWLKHRNGERGGLRGLGKVGLEKFFFPMQTRKKRGHHSELDYQHLEPRQVLNASPIAQDDMLFATSLGTTLNVTAVNGLLKNDFDPEGSNLTASLVGTPSNGQLTLNADGSFQFVPNAASNSTGRATWEYRVSDGVSFSRTARVNVKIGVGLSDAVERGERHNDNPLHTGAQVLIQPLLDGQQLNFRTDKQGSTVVGVTVFAATGTTATSITASLTFAGIPQGTVNYSNLGFATGSNNLMRFAMQAKSTLQNPIPTGHHNWTMTVTINGVAYLYSGTQSVVNWQNSEYGPGWWLDGQDRLIVQTGPNQPNGALLVEGSGRTHFFPAGANPGTWIQAEGDLAYQTLTFSNNEYTLKDKWGDERRFNTDGQLTSVRQLKDLANPVYTYQYEPTGLKRLVSITDQIARTFTFTWPPTNYRVICGGFGGDRQTEVGLPDGNGVFTVREGVFTGSVVIHGFDYTPPLTTFTQTNSNGIFQCGIVLLPSLDQNQGPQSLRTYQFDSFGLLEKIRFHNMVNNEIHEIQLSPTWKQGLKAPTTGNAIHFVANDNARYTDERLLDWKFTTNRFGQMTRWINPLNAQTNYEFNSWGELVREIGVAAPSVTPAGATATSVAPETRYGYSLTGNLLLQKHLGGNGTAASELKWTYHSTLNLPLTATNELNFAETMTYHAATGNLLTYTDRQSNVWTYVYDEQLPTAPLDGLHGRLRTITSPDPDGGGLLQPIVRTYEYSSLNYNLPSRIYNADGSYREWIYDQWDRVTSEFDELSRQTVYVWDEDDRLRSVAKPTGATWVYNYGKNGQVSEEIDPLGNITRYSYDARYRMVSQTLPDPDGAINPLVTPVYTWTYNKTGEVVESTGPTYTAGIKDVYQFDSAGRMTKHIGPLTAQYSNTQETIYEYDLRDRLVRTKDASGRVQKWQYDARDRLIVQLPSDPDDAGPLTGPSTLYGYDAASRMTSTRDELFRQSDYLYSNNGWLTNASLPDPDLSGPQTRSAWIYSHDTLGRQKTVQNPLGRITTTAYDNRHRVSSVTTPDPDGTGSLTAQVYSYQYDLVGNLKQINMPLSRIVQYDYDDLDRMIRVKLPHDSLANQTGPEWNYVYGLTGSPNVTQQTDPLGRITVFAYDNLYRQKQITLPDPDGSGTFHSSPIWKWNYNDRTLLDTVVDPTNKSTTYGYDNAGRTTTMQQPGITGQYSYAYDKLDRLTTVTEPAPGTAGVTASVTEYTYDQRSRLQRVKDARLGTTDYAWNDANELLSLTDSVGNATQWSYDRMGRKVLETNSRGFTRSSEYDKNSNLTRSIDRNGRIVQYTLDALDRMTQEVWNPAATTPPEVTVQTITQGTTGVNEVQRINVANLSATAPGTFVIGFNGKTSAPLNWDATATQVRDALWTTFGGVAADYTVTYALVLGVRQYTVTFTGANAAKNQAQMQGSAKLNTIPAAVRTLEWTFDNGGRLASTTDRDAALVSQSSYQFVYDQLNRMTTETGTIARLTPQIRMGRTYDAVGNRKSLLADLVVGANVTKDFKNEFWFDALNRVSVQTQTVQGTGAGHHLVQDKRATNTYNELGQVTFLIRHQNYAGTGDSLRTVSTYDTANRLSTLSHRNVGTNPTVILSNYVYGYDNMSRITSINHTASVAANADGISNFSYDKTSQLTVADHAPARPDENLSYDLNGNRTGSSFYVTQTNNLTTEDALYTYSYDKEGNRVQRTLKSNGTYEQYLWDHRNRLSQHVSRNAANQMTGYVTYSFDTFNRMVFRREVATNPSTGVATSVRDNWFTGYDGINSTLEFETSGTTSAPNAGTSNITHRLWWGQGVDQLLADEQYSGSVNPGSSVGSVVWALADHLGTIRDIATFNGTSFSIANHRVFDSFGNLTSQTNSAITTAYRYTGKWHDSRTGLSHHWNRWYDPQLGKWISEDPIGFEAGDSNLQRYVGNQSLSARDSFGLMQDPQDPQPPVLQGVPIPGVNPSGPGGTLIFHNPGTIVINKDYLDIQISEITRPAGFGPTHQQIDGTITIGGIVFPVTAYRDPNSGKTVYVFPNGNQTILFPSIELANEFVKNWWELEWIKGAATHTKSAAGFALMLEGGSIPRPSPTITGPRGLNLTVDQFRRIPMNLKEKLAMDEAMAGAGVKIMDKLDDLRYAGMEKWEHIHRNADGTNIVIHFVRDKITGKRLDFKFKDF